MTARAARRRQTARALVRGGIPIAVVVLLCVWAPWAQDRDPQEDPATQPDIQPLVSREVSLTADASNSNRRRPGRVGDHQLVTARSMPHRSRVQMTETTVAVLATKARPGSNSEPASPGSPAKSPLVVTSTDAIASVTASEPSATTAGAGASSKPASRAAASSRLPTMTVTKADVVISTAIAGHGVSRGESLVDVTTTDSAVSSSSADRRAPAGAVRALRVTHWLTANDTHAMTIATAGVAVASTASETASHSLKPSPDRAGTATQRVDTGGTATNTNGTRTAATATSVVTMASAENTCAGPCNDQDGDGYGAPGQPSCSAGTATDCDDGVAAKYPGAPESCDSIDNQCPGDQGFASVDEGCDDDGDDYCDGSMTTVGNPAVCPSGGGDCNDGDGGVFPGAPERVDTIDSDCDGMSELRVQVIHEGPPIQGISGLAASNDGRIYVNSYGGTPSLFHLELSTGLVNTLIGGLPLSYPDRILLGDGRPLVGWDLVVSDHNTDMTSPCCAGHVLRVDPASGDHVSLARGNPLAPSFGDPFGLALGGGGPFGTSLYVMDFEGAASQSPVLYRVHPDGSEEVFLVEPGTWTVDRLPADIAFDQSGVFGGDLFVTDHSTVGRGPTIWRVAADSTLSSFYEGEPLQGPASVRFGLGGAFGDSMYVLDVRPNESVILKFAPDGTSTVLASNLPGKSQPHDPWPDMVFSPAGDNLFVGIGDTVFRIYEPPPSEATCDGLDDDGNGLIDEGCDDDGDEYCDASMTTVGTPAVCLNGPGDCDDNNAQSHPGAPEVCNLVDDNCVNGTADEQADVDGDGYTECRGDCDDNPGQCGSACFPDNPDPDVPDTFDNDCDGQVDEDGATVHGYVYLNAPDLVPVENVSVRLCETALGFEFDCRSDTTDASGFYEFVNVAYLPTYRVIATLTWDDYVATVQGNIPEERTIETGSNEFQIHLMTHTVRDIVFPTPIVFVYGRNGGPCLLRANHTCGAKDCGAEGPQDYWTLAELYYREVGNYMTFVADGLAGCYLPEGVDEESLHDYNAEQLKDYIFNHLQPKIGEFTNNVKVPVDLVTHSMGGLTSRAMIASKLGADAKYIRKLVMLGTPNAGSSGSVSPLAEPFVPGTRYLGQRDLWHFNLSYGDTPHQLGVPFYFVSGLGGQTSSNRLFRYIVSPLEPNPDDGVVAHQSMVDYIVPDSPGSVSNSDFRTSPECHPDLQYPNCLIRIPAHQNLYLCTADDHSALITNLDTLDAVLDLLEDRPLGDPGLLCSDIPGEPLTYSVESTEFFTRMTRASSGQLMPSGSVHPNHLIDPSPESAFLLRWNTGTMSLTLEDPNSTVIDPAYAATDPSIEYVDGTTEGQPVVGYVVTNPTSGTWTLNITAATDVTPAGEDYVATTTSEAPVDATLSVADDLVTVGSTIDLYVVVTDHDTPLAGVTVTATATNRFNTETPLTCLDDGNLPDLTASDGTYSCSYGPLTTSGDHSVAFQVAGTNLSAAAFERTQYTEVSVNSDSATLAGTFWETAIDDDSDSQYETLAIDVDLTVAEAGTYTLSGSLVDASDNLIDTRVVSSVGLSTGPASIRLEFEGFLIREHNVSGPYKLTGVSLNRSDEDRALCDSGSDVYSTAAYSPTVFEIRDPDGDDVASDTDNCPVLGNPLQEDADMDAVGDVCDTCPNDFNDTQADADKDTFGDMCDFCSATPDAFQSDVDGDGDGDNCDTDADADTVLNTSDCGPLDDSVWSVPSEAMGLSWAGKETLNWSPPTSAGGIASVTYDVSKGDLSDLRTSGDFSSAVCMLPHGSATTVPDYAGPSAGNTFYYLVRARSICGPGTYGSGTAGERIVPACP